MKCRNVCRTACDFGSAPTRGPWIEMPPARISGATRRVGPHTGAVD